MPLPPELRSDVDRLKNLLDAAGSMPADVPPDVQSMTYEYLCVAIAGRLEQNIKQILILYANRKSGVAIGAAIARLCQQFQNPDKDKILGLLELFDKDFAAHLRAEWDSEGSNGNTISDMIGLRKAIAHQTTNSRNSTRTKVERYFKAYKATVEQLSAHFLGA